MFDLPAQTPFMISQRQTELQRRIETAIQEPAGNILDREVDHSMHS